MKKFILMAILTAAIVGSVFAQSLPGGWESPTSESTAGIVSSDADDFIRPDAFSNVSFEKWFGFTSFKSDIGLNLGFATKIKDLFLGVYYGGRLWDGIQTFDYTEQTDTWLGLQRTGVRVYQTAPEFTTSPENELSVLVGILGMGFRLTYYTTHQIFKVENALIAGTEIKSGVMEEGIIQPQIAWSMANGLLENGIKPWVTVDLIFYRDYMKHQGYATDNNGAYYALNEEIDTSNNYFQPVISLGLGGFDIVTNENFTATVDLSYTLTITAYDNNEYNYIDLPSGENKTGKFKGTYDSTSGDIIERSSNSHLISPSISGSWENENLTLGFSLALNLGFGSEKSVEEGLTPSGSLLRSGVESKKTFFSFIPEICLGAQWRVNSRLALNVGGSIGLELTTATTEGKSYIDDNELPNSSTRSVVTEFGSVSNKLSIGAAFNITDNLAFSANCGILADNAVSFTDTTGLLTFGSLLVSLKF
jgi:hypothetical protein